MNERAREALVAAALKGTRQIKETFRDMTDGRCALGVLLESAGFHFGFLNCPKFAEAMTVFGISEAEHHAITDANDNLGWDFLTIARKIGNDAPQEGA